MKKYEKVCIRRTDAIVYQDEELMISRVMTDIFIWGWYSKKCHGFLSQKIVLSV